MNLLYRIYFALPAFARFGIAGKIVNRGIAIAVKKTFDAFVPAYLKRHSNHAPYGLNVEKRKEVFIVSLTSFPGRIADIWITIDIMLRQTFKPDALILWLSRDQFAGIEIPESLKQLQKRGLTIRFCDEDLRAHKKYYYAIQEFPHANIITIDDDLYYDLEFLQNLVDLHDRYPRYIVTNRAHRITMDSEGKIRPYRKWIHNVTDKRPSHLLVATGGAGTLYPSGSLDERVVNAGIFKKYSFHADDIWLKFMALLKGTVIATNGRYNKDFVTIKTSQHQKLVTTNVLSGGNDEQFQNLLTVFELKESVFLE